MEIAEKNCIRYLLLSNNKKKKNAINTLFSSLINMTSSHRTFVIDLAVAVYIRFPDHLVDLFVRQLLAEVGHYVAEFGRRYETVTVFVEHSERLADLLLAVRVFHFTRHHREEFWEVDRAVT